MFCSIVTLVPNKWHENKGNDEAKQTNSVGPPVTHLIPQLAKDANLENYSYGTREALCKTNFRWRKTTSNWGRSLREYRKQRIEGDVAKGEYKVRQEQEDRVTVEQFASCQGFVTMMLRGYF